MVEIYYQLPGYITMSSWNIVVIELSNGQVFERFLGFDTNEKEFRISSQILSYDAENQIGSTKSGSQYKFIDEPGKLHPDAQAVFDYINKSGEAKASLKFPVSYDS